EPPPSSYPRIDAGTLVPIHRVKFPKIPGAALPTVIHAASRLDFGPDWNRGNISVEPPRLGKAFSSLVSQVDKVGNEVASLRSLELLVPLATYAPWNLRAEHPGGSGELTDFLGTYIPFPRTEAERARSGDPRPSIEARYATKVHYLSAASKAAASLVAAGYLLSADIPRVLDRAARHWDWIMQQ
ncbi:MAG: hypothetical protein HY724_12135, partial [Candidatus Rokubacteria bacterium]|nr:hypothetical protein [Candidatus Rokubacteria bacterium]